LKHEGVEIQDAFKKQREEDAKGADPTKLIEERMTI